MRTFRDFTWKEKCIDVFKEAEYDPEVLKGLQFLGRRAIEENRSIYEIIMDNAVEFQEKKTR